MKSLRRPAAEEDRDEPIRPGPRKVEPLAPREAPPERPVSHRSLLGWILAAALLLLVAIISQHFDEFLRRTLESKINQRLHGYTVTLEGAHLNPFGLALTLRESVIRQERFQLADSVVSLVNRAADRPYRVFVDGTDLVVTNLSSGFQDGPAVAKLTGRFMGSGAARASATFREEGDGPSFDLNVAIEGASLPSMNELLRAYGKLDVTEGTFSLFSEVKVNNRRITGYVKPLIKDVKVYDPDQDKKKPVLKKLYEKVVGGLSHVLENRPRDEVATVADLSGSIDDPNTSTWEIVVRLVSNAFVRAILPGFDREFEAARRGR